MGRLRNWWADVTPWDTHYERNVEEGSTGGPLRRAFRWATGRSRREREDEGARMRESGSEMMDMSTDEIQGIIEQMRGEYGTYTSAVERLLDSSPRISYKPQMEQLAGMRGDIMSQYDQNMGSMLGYRQGLLDEYLGAAGDIRDTSQVSLDAALGAYGDYLGGMRTMAQTDLPGIDVYRGQIGAQTAQGMQQLRDVGGLSAGSMTSLLANQADQQRNLAVQSAQYKSQRQEALANAYANYGQMSQSAYGQRMGAIGQAGQLSGQAYTGAMGATQAMGQMGQAAYGQAASLLGQETGLQSQQYIYNQLMPYQNQLNWAQGQAQAMNPYQAALGAYGSLAGLGYSQWQSGMNISQQMDASRSQTWQSLLPLIGMLAQSGMGAMGGGGV